MVGGVPENNKKPGLSYAWTDDGIELPVIDITHPAFAYDPAQEELSGLIDEAIRNYERIRSTPPAEVRAAAERSIMMRLWLQSADTILSGMGTYLSKLGPDNLGEGWAGPVDRRIAAGLTPSSFRLRLPRVARLIADALGPGLASGGRRPVHLINIAGGPAADSFNALILLQREHSEWLAGRRISIHVLDIDPAGPNFGARAVAALTSDGATLHGLDVGFHFAAYDWTKPAALRDVIGGIGVDNSVVAGSSEGGLFLYASEGDIMANLNVFRDCTPADAVMVGSFAREAATLDARLRTMVNLQGAPAIRYLGLDAFRSLAANAGWEIERTLDDPFVHNVTMRKACCRA